MPRLRPQHWRKVVAAFETLGYRVHRQHGSHIVMIRAGAPRPVVIPRHVPVAVGTMASNIRSAGITVEEFVRILERKA